MEKLKALVRENRYVLFLLYWPLYLLVFFSLDWLELNHHLIVCGLDQLIPFNEYFVIIYLGWTWWFSGLSFFILYIALKPWLRVDCPRLLRKKTRDLMDPGDLKNEFIQANLAKQDYIKLSTVMFLGMTLSLITYVVWPNMIDLREPVTGHNIFAGLVRFVRSFDSPYNVCPSIHIVTITVEALVVKDSALKVFTPKRKIWIYLLTVLIAYSTLAVKQHSVVDVGVGAALGGALYLIYMMISGIKFRMVKCEGSDFPDQK